jgi:hypothetical protein
MFLPIGRDSPRDAGRDDRGGGVEAPPAAHD